MDLLALHKAQPERYPFLLESVTGKRDSTARYSLLLAFPGDTLSLTPEGLFENDERLEDDDFLARLGQHFTALNPQPTEGAGDLPFAGGWFVYLGYELAAQIEPSLRLPKHASKLPMALAVRCRGAVVLDHQTGQLELAVECDRSNPEKLRAQMQLDIDALTGESANESAPEITRFEEDPDQRFLDSVGRIQEYIRAGDVFQVNLSREWRIECAKPTSASQLYSQLRKANPAPFSGLFEWQGQAVVSSSPERLISIRGRELQTRPIAGTRPRQQDNAENGLADEAMRDELLLHPKERAEHIMLIDLERNDLGRVCEPGSIEVNELLGLESHAHVHHIVSNVRGRLREDCSPVDAIRAVFPGGTITGCPKVHCMEIIAELEQAGRGPYTGAMGYLDRRGNLDLNILIRSLESDGKQIRFRAGAGIVADSCADAELAETRAKARGLLKALGVDG